MKKLCWPLLSFIMVAVILCPGLAVALRVDPLMELDDPYKFQTTEKMHEFKQILSNEFEKLKVQQELTVQLEEQLNETWFRIKPAFEQIWIDQDRVMLRVIRPYKEQIVLQDAAQERIRQQMCKLRDAAHTAVEHDDALELEEIVRKLVKRAEQLNRSIQKEIDALQQLEKTLCPGSS